MLAVFLGAVLALGAQAPIAGAPSPSPSPPTPTPTPTPAPRRPDPVPVSRAIVVEPAGRTPLVAGGESVVDAASSFEVELAGRVADARLVLLDGADAHVPARATSEVGTVTRLALAPASPLVPGSRYVLRVEGATTRELHRGDGAYGPASFQLLVAGTPPPPEPKKKPKSKRRGRR